MDTTKSQNILATIEAIPELPDTHLITYARLWQFETWLRHMVYVELRAKYGDDWGKSLRGNVNNAKKSDQKLTHMPSPEKMDLSFGTLGALTNTISTEWSLFEKFLPYKTSGTPELRKSHKSEIALHIFGRGILMIQTSYTAYARC